VSAKKKISIIEAIHDRRLFGGLPAFKSLTSWGAWLSFLKTLFGIEMDADEFEAFKKCTGRTQAPRKEFAEAFLIIGRRGGKSFVAALTAVFVAAFSSFAGHLNVGEVATILVLARDREQARVVFRYARGIIEAVPVLRQMVVNVRADEIELDNGAVLAVKTSDYRAVRGATVACAICDEIAFWDSEGVNPDNAVLAALRPAMSTIPGAKLLCISTGYAKAGTLFENYRDHFGRDDSDVLVWQADTRTMNPTISERLIEKEIARDPEAARAEWGGLFREDVSAAFPLELLEKCIIPGRSVLPYSPDFAYKAFSDPSGGRRDKWAQAIGHYDGRKLIIDRLDFWKSPLDTAAVTAECANILKSYRVLATTGDNYAGAWPVGEFAKNGIAYEQAAKPKSELYLSLIPLLSAGDVELPDNKEMLTEFRRLERRRGRNGKDSIDHLPSLFDDVANATAGLCYLLSNERGNVGTFWSGGERTFGGESALYDDALVVDGDRRGGSRSAWDFGDDDGGSHTREYFTWQNGGGWRRT